MLSMDSVGHEQCLKVENEYPTHIIVQAQRIVRLQVYCGLCLSPWNCKPGHDKALIVTFIGSPHLFKQRLRETLTGSPKQFDGYDWHLVGWPLE